MDVINGVKNNTEKNQQKCELTSDVILDSGGSNAKIANNSECERKRFYEIEDSHKERQKNNNEVNVAAEKISRISSAEKKAFALPSSQFHARFADNEHNTDDEIVIERANSHQINEKNVIKQTSSNNSQSIVSPKRHFLNNQKSNNTIPPSVEFKTSTIRKHYYPEGSWGWVVVVCAMFCHIITFGLQLSFGIFLMHLIKQPFGREKYMNGIWMGSLSLGLSCLISPLIVSWCRRKSARLTAIAGGLVSSLGCLFASFANQFHQVFLSYGIFLSIGIGIARESSNLMVGQYFKRKRSFVEIFVQSSIGIGVALMAPFINWCIGTSRHWRAGLQLITCALFATFIIAILYRPASVYHPQRRAILHLKTQRRKIREKNPQTNKPPFFDLTPLSIRSVQIILISTFLFSFGYLSPLFYLTKIVRVLNQTSVEEMVTLQNAVIPSSVINLYIYFGISFTIGVILFGYLAVNRNSECRINGQYLCLTSMILIVLLLIASIYLNDYYGYVVFVIAYGIAIGAFHYTNKMLVFSQVKTKAFSKAWSYVQCGQSFAILIGVPITGYINNWFDESSHHNGFILSTIFCLSGTLVLCTLNTDSGNLLPNVSNKLHPFHQHSCSTSETTNLHALTVDRKDSDGIQSEHNCYNCGQKLLLSDDNEGFKEYNSIKVDECRPPSPKRSRAVDEDEDEDDEDFIHVPDLGTFYSDELCNYYLQNDGEEGIAFRRIYDQNAEAFKERIIPDTGFECEIATIDYSHSKKHSICDSSDVKHVNPSKRTIETVAEETSSIA